MTDAEVVNEVLHVIAVAEMTAMVILLAILLGVIGSATFFSHLENKTLTPDELEGKRFGYRAYKKGPRKPS